MNIVPVIDLFAGPGGLGEGFSSLKNKQGRSIFKIGLSIEKDPLARKTLLMRAFFREFQTAPAEYYSYLSNSHRSDSDRGALFSTYKKEAEAAEKEAWCAELGVVPDTEVKIRINKALNGAKEWVLIGGPPCQAYSLVGRSRMKGSSEESRKKFEADKRHYLYQEYLRIIADNAPSIFILENVKGLLSSTVGGEKIFDKIIEDLEHPGNALTDFLDIRADSNLSYKIFPVVKTNSAESFKPSDFIVKSELYGIPQARHRVIILGIRSDICHNYNFSGLIPASGTVSVSAVISDLPKLRSSLSKQKDSLQQWISAVTSIKKQLSTESNDVDTAVLSEIYKSIDELSSMSLDTGAEFVPAETIPDFMSEWYKDGQLNGVCNHFARGHMESDLHRYMFAACYTNIYGRSPTLKDYPKNLLPNHDNVSKALNGAMFADRFRVQVNDNPATTVTSHISKDGHYFIHPDPVQCRSLTVREAARLQTFPDNYLFEGPRTSQYQQVGNAVPPYLARQIAQIVYDILKDVA